MSSADTLHPSRHCVPSLTPAELLALDDPLVIDLRSPAEHAHDSIPGAHNVPLFDDARDD